MTYRHSTADFAGITVDAFLDDDNNSYITLSSLGAGLGVSRQNTNYWLKKHNKGIEGIPVTVGQFNKAATAYPASVIREFISYRRSLGDVKAEALTDAIVQAAFDRHAKETNLVIVTAAQNEVVLATVRMDLVRGYAFRDYTKKSNCKAYDEFHATATTEEKELAFDLKFLNQERTVATRLGKRLTTLNENDRYRYNMAVGCIELTKTKLQAQGVSC